MQPKTDPEIEEFNLKAAQFKRNHTVIMVDPQGIIREIICGPDKDDLTSHSTGINVLQYHEGSVVVRNWAMEKGWTLLKDRCREDGQTEVFTNHMLVVNARMDGHQIQVKIEDILPRSVIAQRAAGHAVVEPLKFVLGKGLVPAGDVDVTEDEKRERMRKLLGAPKLGTEEADGAPKLGTEEADGAA